MTMAVGFVFGLLIGAIIAISNHGKRVKVKMNDKKKG
jgi:hypothetical protein